MSLSSVLGPFIGQNWGAGRYERVQTAVRQSELFSLAWGVLLLVIFAFFGRHVAALFNTDPVVIENVALYLWLIPISYGFQGMLRLTAFALNVLERPLYATALTVFQMFVLYIPLAYAGAALFDLTGIFAAASTAHIIAGIVAFFVLRMVLVRSTAAATARVEARTA
jgi:Na+-driven multidrug efflux pump